MIAPYVVVRMVGYEEDIDIEWPEGWPIPREGEAVEGIPVEGAVVVRSVLWYPLGEDGDPEPFVCLILGKPRPR